MKGEEIVTIVEKSFRTLDKLCHKMLKEFDAQDIHDFRVEVKKIRAFLRLLAIKKEEDEPLIPKLLKTFYGYIGTVRNIQLSESSLSKYAKAHSVEIPAGYLKLLDDEKNYWKKEVGRLMEDNSFHDIKKKIIKELPNDLEKSSIKKFVNDKLADLEKYLKDLNNDNALHNIRKALKDLLYTRNYIEDHIGLPVVISDKRKLKSITTVLGNFIDESMRLKLLRSVYLGKIKDENDEILLVQIERKWNSEKLESKQKLQRRLRSLQKQLSAVKYQTNNINT